MATGPTTSADAPGPSPGPGDRPTLLDELAQRGLPNVVRSVRYHRPRGPFCGTGDCTGCLVRVNGRPNVRACRHLPADGDRLGPGNAWPSARFDLLGAIDLLFPSGVDTLRGFRRPAWAHGLFHRVNRRLAGYGPPPAVDAVAPGPPSRVIDTEVAIVGAGRAGTAAAATLVARGMHPLLIDRRFDATAPTGAELLAGTTVTFLPPPASAPSCSFTLLGYRGASEGVCVRSRAVLLATGSYDGSLLFGGNDRPGIVAAELALRWARPGLTSPLRRAVVVGGGARAAEVLDRLGPAVVAVAAPGQIGPEVARRASDRGIPLYPRSLLLHANGRRRVRSVRLRTRGGGPRFSIRCDAVVLAHRRLPNAQMLFQAGASLRWRSEPGAYLPRATEAGATTVPGLWVAGSMAGVAGDDSARSGDRAALSIVAGSVVPPEPEGPPEEMPLGELDGYYRELLHEPRQGRWVACPCEDILWGEVEAAHARGYSGIEVVKRYTGVGTGLCQGRYCLPDALLLLSILEQRPPPEVGYITQRPPAVPTPLGALAGLRDSVAGETSP